MIAHMRYELKFERLYEIHFVVNLRRFARSSFFSYIFLLYTKKSLLLFMTTTTMWSYHWFWKLGSWISILYERTCYVHEEWFPLIHTFLPFNAAAQPFQIFFFLSFPFEKFLFQPLSLQNSPIRYRMTSRIPRRERSTPMFGRLGTRSYFVMF